MTTSNSSLNIEKCVRNKIRLDKIWAMTIIYGKTQTNSIKLLCPFAHHAFASISLFVQGALCAMDGQDTWPSHRFKVLNSTAVPGYPGIDIDKSYLSTRVHVFLGCWLTHTSLFGNLSNNYGTRVPGMSIMLSPYYTV